MASEARAWVYCLSLLREDRRHINRKSAQKHRARRKEEAETMSRQIAERDSKIVQLEQALAVERAKLQQVLSWIKEVEIYPIHNLF